VLAEPLDALAVTLLALPFTVAGVRTNPLTGVTRALGATVAYFAGSAAIGALATGGTLPLSAVTWLPLALVVAGSVGLYRREI
jgi:lipopolysaccharide export LptBFGC system permease protein LptF